MAHTDVVIEVWSAMIDELIAEVRKSDELLSDEAVPVPVHCSLCARGVPLVRTAVHVTRYHKYLGMLIYCPTEEEEQSR